MSAIALLVVVLRHVSAAPEELQPLIDALKADGFDAKIAAIDAIGATGDPRAVPAFEALGDGALNIRLSDGKIVIAHEGGDAFSIIDSVTGEDLGSAGAAALEKIKVNNKMRRAIRAALGGLTLLSPDLAVRRDAANAIFKSRDASALETLETAIDRESDAEVKRMLEEARAAVLLTTDAPEEVKLPAIPAVRDRGDKDALALLNEAAGRSPEAVTEAARVTIRSIEHDLALWSGLQNVTYGLSLGSVLLLAATGLAITFGVLGVINMAHGEMVTVGAYVAFIAQGVARS